MIVIISDLDGSLLDAETYSFEKARPALSLIINQQIPLVLCSSKTRAEIDVYRKKLQNRHPFISENGGGLFIPNRYFSFPIQAEPLGDYQVITSGLPYKQIRSHFIRLRQQCKIAAKGFGDMAASEIAELTGLSLVEARLAQQRDFDEAFVFSANPDERFLHAIELAGLCWTRGKMYHILGNHDKGRAVLILRDLYQKQYGMVRTIGLGDSLNDQSLLSAVDQAVLIRHPDGTFDSEVSIPGIIKTDKIGPEGWNEALLTLLEREFPGKNLKSQKIGEKKT